MRDSESDVGEFFLLYLFLPQLLLWMISLEVYVPVSLSTRGLFSTLARLQHNLHVLKLFSLR